MGSAYVERFSIIVQDALFVPVQSVTFNNASVTLPCRPENDSSPLELTFDIYPANATSQAIVWNNPTPIGQGARMIGNHFTAIRPGVYTITGFIPNGLPGNENFTEISTTVTVEEFANFVPVTGIDDVNTTAIVGELFHPLGTAVPSNATDRRIIWGLMGAVNASNAPLASVVTSFDHTGGTGRFTATEPGTVRLMAVIVNGLGTNMAYSEMFTIRVGAPPVITTASVPGGNPGEMYAATLEADGCAPIVWSIIDGDLPDDLVLDEDTGEISGELTESGEFTFTVQAENDFGSDTRTFTIVVSTVPVITTTSLPNAAVGEWYRVELAATGTAPIAWGIQGLPAGLTANGAVISGRPTVVTGGTFPLTVTATNAAGYDEQIIVLIVEAPPVIITTTLPDGIIGVPYADITLAATGLAPITWDATGLPDGLTLNDDLISGTPTEGGFFDITITATNDDGVAILEVTIFIAEIPTITTASLPNGILGVSYTVPLEADGDEVIYWVMTGGALPAGLSLNNLTGVISGTPTAGGNFSITVEAFNSAGISEEKVFPFTIAVPPVITTTGLPNGILGDAYSATLAATGDPTITFSISGHPAGLSVTGNTISGTPTASGPFTITVTASNATGINDTRDFDIFVAVRPTITTTSLPGATRGVPYSASLAATGDAAIIWSITAGSLPAGLALNNLTGAITGTPTATATGETFTIEARNSAGAITSQFVIAVAAPPVITTASLPGGTVGEAYSVDLAATGDAPITWDATGLPAGLDLSGSTISGTPTVGGSFTVTVTASNATGINDVRNFTIFVAVKPTITTTALPDGVLGRAYSQSLVATGDPVISWSISDGDLPDGITLSPAGVMSGTATESGTFNFTVKAENGAGYDTQDLAIKIVVLPEITTASLANAVLGVPYTATLAATGEQPITWSITNGRLPAALYFNGETGVISGTPTENGTFTFTVAARNEAGTITKELTLFVGVAPTIVTTSLPNGTRNADYNVELIATGDATIVWSIVDGELPAGLALENGRIIGRPTDAGKPGEGGKLFAFTIRATNNSGYEELEVSIRVFLPTFEVTVYGYQCEDCQKQGCNGQSWFSKFHWNNWFRKGNIKCHKCEHCIKSKECSKCNKGTTGSGIYEADSVVTITTKAPKGTMFVQWEIDPSVTFTSGNAKKTTASFIMPESDVTAVATFANTIFTTRYTSNLWNWVLFFVAFGWIWMWF